MTNSTERWESSSFTDHDVTPSAWRRYHLVEMQTDAALVQATSVIEHRFAIAGRRVCLRFAMRMLGCRADAEEATQETMLRAHRSLARFDLRMNYRTWLMSILVNRCRSMLLYRRRRTARVMLDEAAMMKASVPSASADIELRDAIDRALERLDPPMREAFLLKHVEQLSYDEIAEITQVGVSALKMRVQRACERLQVILGEDRYA